VHEFAHVLSESIDLSPATSHQARIGREMLIALCRAEPQSLHLPWLHHEPPFLRALLHLCYRVEQIDDSVPLSLVLPPNYELSSPWAYQCELGDEPERFARASFAGINLLPLPRGFAALFDADVARWEKTGAQTTGGGAAQCTDACESPSADLVHASAESQRSGLNGIASPRRYQPSKPSATTRPLLN
jgi:hypothetical protein